MGGHPETSKRAFFSGSSRRFLPPVQVWIGRLAPRHFGPANPVPVDWMAMVSCVLLSVLAAPQYKFASTASNPNEKVIGVDPVRYGTLYWNEMPQPDTQLHVTVGTKLVFKYSSEHDVSLSDSESGWLNCNGEFDELASTTEGGGAAGEPANVFEAVVDAVGE